MYEWNGCKIKDEYLMCFCLTLVYREDLLFGNVSFFSLYIFLLNVKYKKLGL